MPQLDDTRWIEVEPPRRVTPDDEPAVFSRTADGGYLWERPIALKKLFAPLNREAASLFMKAMKIRPNKFYEKLNETYHKRRMR